MEDRTVHELTAAYALDALDENERRTFEEHLSGCARCREELADLSQTAALLAHGAPAATPPPALRERILADARDGDAKVIPFPRRSPVVLGVAAVVTAAAAVIAIAFGVQWASVSQDLDEARNAVDVLADPAARSVPLEGANGRVVVNSKREAALTVQQLRRAPKGHTYELWVIRDGTPRRAGLFEGDEEPDVVLLEEQVDENATVAVTLEQDGGVDAPTSRILFSASV
ncbi:MAG TPA: anti-sigma factor [Gaiellaceae bacterium]|jgi:anti-sigma-K factor RskA|nr:anti-sigma factor [Gaiellaceae bacterium]